AWRQVERPMQWWSPRRPRRAAASRRAEPSARAAPVVRSVDMARAPQRERPLRRVPSVDALLRTEAARRGCEQFGRPLVKHAIRQVLADVRDDAAHGTDPPGEDIVLARALRVAALTWYGLSPVVN